MHGHWARLGNDLAAPANLQRDRSCRTSVGNYSRTKPVASVTPGFGPENERAGALVARKP